MMGKRGRERDLDREVPYWELIASGIGTVEACRRVGVTRKTGYRWRSEMGGVIPKKPTVSSGCYLSLFERQRIASWHDRGAGVRDIARRIGPSPSTVSRELRRNCRDWDDGYEPVLAHLRAEERAKCPKPGKRLLSLAHQDDPGEAGDALEPGTDPPSPQGPARVRQGADGLRGVDLPGPLPAYRGRPVEVSDAPPADSSHAAPSSAQNRPPLTEIRHINAQHSRPA